MHDRHNKNISLGLLVGGQSKRFGSEKYRALIDGTPMVQKVYRAAEGFVDEILVSIGTKKKVIPLAEYEEVLDSYPGAGPLAGIHACMAAMQSDWLLVLACDLPYVSKTSLESLTSAIDDQVKLVIARGDDGTTQPLCACYHRSVLWGLTSALEAGKNSVYRFVDSLDAVREVDVPATELINVNRPNDIFSGNS